MAGSLHRDVDVTAAACRRKSEQMRRKMLQRAVSAAAVLLAFALAVALATQRLLEESARARPSPPPLREGWATLESLRARLIGAGKAPGPQASPPAREPEPSDTPVYIIRTEQDARDMAAFHATPEKEIMFTTVSFKHKREYHPEMAEFAAHLWQSLDDIKRSATTVLITHHLQTCQAVMELRIPCFLDRWSLQPSQLPGQYRRDVPHFYLKFAWALVFVRWGYTALFVEMDQAFLGDPLPHLRKEVYDLEDLSDWRTAEIPKPKTRALETCPHYHMIKLSQAKGNAYDSRNTIGQRLEWGPSLDDEPESTSHINPCASTGFWAVQPVPSVVRWLTDFIDIALFKQNEQIEQQVWNQMIGAYLYGTSKYPPLRLGLFDDSKFLNTEVYSWRLEQNLTVAPVMLHAANRQGSEAKRADLIDLGLWRAGAWRPNANTPRLRELSARFQRTLPYYQR